MYLADRPTDMILAGGANVYPAEVEAALDEHPRVRSCAVIGLPDDDLGNRIHAIVQHRRRHADRRRRAARPPRRAPRALQDPARLRVHDRAAARRRGQDPPLGAPGRAHRAEYHPHRTAFYLLGAHHGDRRFRRFRRRQPLLRGHRLVHAVTCPRSTRRSCSGPRSAASSG